MQRKSKSTVHGRLRVTLLTAPPPPPGLRGAGPARPRAGAPANVPAVLRAGVREKQPRVAQPGPESPPAEALDIVGRNSCPMVPTYRIQQPRAVVASTTKKKAPSQLRCGQCPQQTRRVQTALLTKLLHQGPGRAGRGLRAGRAEARKKAKTLCAVVRIPSAIPESEASRSNVSKTHLEGVPWWQSG